MSVESHWQIFELIAQSNVDRIAAWENGTEFTYGDLLEKAVRLSTELNSQGLRGGQRVSVWCRSDASSLIAMLALWRSGAIALFLPDSEEHSLEVERGGGVQWRINTRELTTTGNCQLELTSRPDSYINEHIASELFMLFATSGTTATPKIVAHSRSSLISSLWSTIALQAETLALNRMDGAATFHVAQEVSALSSARMGLRFLSFLPISSIAGYTVAQRALLTGEAVGLCVSGGGDSILDAILQFEATNVSLTPLLGRQLLRAARHRGVSGSSLLLIGVGGSRVSEWLLADLEEQFGCPVVPGYGMTETGGPVIMPRVGDPAERRHKGYGRPLPGVAVDLLQNPESTDFGEVVVKGSCVMLGYWPDGPLANGVHRTGDLAEKEAADTYRIVGRSDGAILRAGRFIDATHIEEVALERSEIRRAAVVGRASRVAGEDDVILFVEMDRSSFDESDLLEWLRDRLEVSEVPRRIYLQPSMPLSADGSIRKNELRELRRS